MNLTKDQLLEALKSMLRIRNFEIRAESAYQHGKVGGFFHAYIGQEAIQTAAVMALGVDNWWTTTYRCHALALLLGATPNEIMAELYGRANGNAKGRGGSMHLYTDRLLGGFGIVGGQVPVATGAAFTLKYQEDKNRISICFLGDGAVPQGAFHESLNLAALWKLPCLYVIENNIWGMGTHFKRANSVEKLAEAHAKAYGIQGYTIDGTDFFTCYETFKKLGDQIKVDSTPILLEVIAERFRGHSISDPDLYRSKDNLKEVQTKDPIIKLKEALIAKGFITEEEFQALNKQYRDEAAAAMDYAEASPWPELSCLGDDVYARD